MEIKTTREIQENTSNRITKHYDSNKEWSESLEVELFEKKWVSCEDIKEFFKKYYNSNKNNFCDIWEEIEEELNFKLEDFREEDKEK